MSSLLLIDTYYREFLKDHNLDTTNIGTASYSESLGSAVEAGFGTGGAYVKAFHTLGWNADIVVPNSLTLQSQWAREHGARAPIPTGWQFGPHLARLPVASELLHKFPHIHGMVLQQVKDLRPDVVMVQDINLIPPAMAREMKKYCTLLVGEIASPLPPKRFLMSYDMILSAPFRRHPLAPSTPFLSGVSRTCKKTRDRFWPKLHDWCPALKSMARLRQMCSKTGGSLTTIVARRGAKTCLSCWAAAKWCSTVMAKLRDRMR
jgi:hypothetical protein